MDISLSGIKFIFTIFKNISPLLLNMYTFTINTETSEIYSSILWYISKLKNDNEHFCFFKDGLNRDNNDEQYIDFLSYSDDIKFKYKDYEISLKKKRIDDARFSMGRHELCFFEEMNLTITDENLSDDEQIKLIKDFILESKELFDKNKRYTNSEDKLILYSYSDSYWDDIKRINKRKLDTIILDPDIKKNIKSVIERYNNEDLKNKLKSFGINHKLNLVLSGLPGTGKSSLMISIASILSKDIATIDFNDKITDTGFIRALNRMPSDCLFALEDIDSLYINREKSMENNKISFSCILNFLDGMYSKTDQVTVITTNHLDKLDKAIIRPMRIDKIFKFSYCSKYQSETIFNIFFPESNIFDDIYKLIKNKKYTTAMLQKWFITYIYEPDELLNNIKIFEELIDVSSDKDYNMFT